MEYLSQLQKSLAWSLPVLEVMFLIFQPQMFTYIS